MQKQAKKTRGTHSSSDKQVRWPHLQSSRSVDDSRHDFEESIRHSSEDGLLGVGEVGDDHVRELDGEEVENRKGTVRVDDSSRSISALVRLLLTQVERK